MIACDDTLRGGTYIEPEPSGKVYSVPIPVSRPAPRNRHERRAEKARRKRPSPSHPTTEGGADE